MAPPDKFTDELMVAIHEGTAYVRVCDRGSFKISKNLKDFGISAIDEGVRRIVVDLSECVGMDSTFMGVLAGLALRLRKLPDGELYVVNLSSRTRGLLATLGLDQLVKPCMTMETPEEFKPVLEGVSRMRSVENSGESRRETAETMLEAHECLVEISPDNVLRFKDVLSFLREDLNKSGENTNGDT